MLERKSNKAWLYLTPALLLLAVFTFYPLFNAFLISFFSNVTASTMETDGFTGFSNYIHAFHDDDFMRALGNTTFITLISVPISIILALLISVGLKSITKLQGVFQTIFFLPYVTNAIAIGMAFAFIFNQDYGLLNTILGWFGLGGAENIAWIGLGATWGRAMTALLVFIVWKGLAFKILIFLSGLQGIDKQYYDAARIDAAPRRRIFTKITIPLLSPLIAYITITSFIGSFKVYTVVVGMFGAGMGWPGAEEELLTVVGMVYRYVGDNYGIGYDGYAAALAIILFIFILIFTGIQMQISKRRVHY